MPTEQKTETREAVAKGLVMRVKELLYTTSLTKQDWQMVRAIEAALKDRNERAARIAETAFEEFQTGHNAGKWIAAAIRNEDHK